MVSAEVTGMPQGVAARSVPSSHRPISPVSGPRIRLNPTKNPRKPPASRLPSMVKKNLGRAFRFSLFSVLTFIALILLVAKEILHGCAAELCQL